MTFNGTNSTWTSMNKRNNGTRSLSDSGAGTNGNNGNDLLAKTGKFFKTVAKKTKDGAKKLDEKTNFTGILTGVATGVAAHRVAHGQMKSGAKALGVAAASAATKEHFSQERERER
mmetsp:Transcript_25950/g.39759  ORF Transcript_25950/g.39759 Transcript_25950/m.39759 type:complete len:116 (-) Transcript_25950:122-469(-)